MIKKTRKARKGTLGERRNEYARYLALHFMHADCRLARKFISILFSTANTEPFERLEYDEIAEMIAEKMKSV